MVCTAYIDPCGHTRCDGVLGDVDRPFATVEDAIDAWYCQVGKTPGSADALTIVVLSSAIIPLYPRRYSNIRFTKIAGSTYSVIFVSGFAHGIGQTIFSNVTFDNVQHIWVIQYNAFTGGSVGIYEGVNVYENNALLSIELRDLGDLFQCGAQCLEDCDTCCNRQDDHSHHSHDNHSRDNHSHNKPCDRCHRKNDQCHCDKKNSDRRLGSSVAGKTMVEQTESNIAPNLKQTPIFPNIFVPPVVPTVSGSPIPVVTIITVATGGSLTAPISVQAPNLAIIGYQNNGLMNVVLKDSAFGSGSIINGPGQTLIHDSVAEVVVNDPRFAIISGPGVQRVLDSRITIRQASGNGATIAPTNDERPVPRGTPSTNTPQDTILLRETFPLPTTISPTLRASCNEPVLTTSRTEVSRTSINACGVGSKVYISDDLGARLDYNNFTCVNIYGLDKRDSDNGPIFSIYSSSSLVTNGSVFFIPRLIDGNYTHQRLDGELFDIHVDDDDVSGHHSDQDDRRLGHRRPSCREVTINLSSCKDWNGRRLTYIRTDCSSATVIIKTDGRIQGRHGGLEIRPRETITLQNIGGDYYVLFNRKY